MPRNKSKHGEVQQKNRSNPTSQQEANVIIQEFHKQGHFFVASSMRQRRTDVKTHSNGNIEGWVELFLR